MTRRQLPHLGPSLLVGAGIIVATLVSVRSADSGWQVMIGPAILALAVLGAGSLEAWLRGQAPRPGWVTTILAASVIASCAIVASSRPDQVATFLPIIGACGWTGLLLPEHRRSDCRR